MKGFYKEVEARIIPIFNAYTEMQRRKHEYYPGISLYPPEIHAIECIALTNPINMTELARMMGMTNGGVSKCVRKLEKMELVRKYKYVRNQKEIYLHLTDLGVKAFQGHKLYHKKMDQAMEAYGDELTDGEGAEILRFLDTYLRQMRELPVQAAADDQEKGD